MSEDFLVLRKGRMADGVILRIISYPNTCRSMVTLEKDGLLPCPVFPTNHREMSLGGCGMDECEAFYIGYMKAVGLSGEVRYL